MPITPSGIANDPQAPLAWQTSVVVVALEKLRRSIPIDQSEKVAIKSLADQLDLLTKASQVRFNETYCEIDPPPSSLHSSIFTLVAISDSVSSISKPPTLEETGKNLRNIYEDVLEDDILHLDSTILDNTQNLCVDLLEHLSKQRPSTPIR